MCIRDSRRVTHRARRLGASRLGAAEPGAPREVQPKIEPTCLLVELHRGHPPRLGQTQRRPEHLVRIHILSMKVKTGISHWRLRPTLAVIDPLLTMSLPAEVSAASGMDSGCHALESYTARHYTAFAAKQPEQRVTYCGSNPVSDLWCERAMACLLYTSDAADEEDRVDH